MTSTMDPRSAPPSDRRILNLAYALANNGSVDLSALCDADARAVWRIVWAIVAWRREQGLPQPRPGRVRKLSQDRMRGILSVVAPGEDPNAIVAEILAEPLLQAVLWILAAMVARAAVPPLVLSVTVPGGSGP